MEFEEIRAWQSARRLTQRIYVVTDAGSFRQDFDLRRQIRRASVSIMSNIAEGFERDGRKEFISFLSIAKGSAGEVRSQLYVALDAEYLSETEFNEIVAVARLVSRQLSRLIRYLRRSSIPGSKFPRG